MNNSPRLREIKHAQREAQVLREVSNFFLRITLDDPRLQGIYISRVKLSANRSMCTIFFYTPGGITDYEAKRPILVMYKPTLRTALSKTLHGRYTPDLVFDFDAQYEKQRKVDDLLEQLHHEDEESS
jgi:ribosome-binding factor A